jgi:hypothetical protein
VANGSRLTPVYDPKVKAFARDNLCPRDRDAVKRSVRDFAECPELGDPIRTEPEVRYVKTYNVNRSAWPHGLRIAGKVVDAFLAIIRIGDHTRCSDGECSFYLDD